MFALEKFAILNKRLTAFRKGLVEALDKMGEAARMQTDRLAARKAALRHTNKRTKALKAACHEGWTEGELAREKTYRGLKRTLKGMSERLADAVSETTAWI
ncbi:MAG: hypothetical protein AB1921_03705 [Thermodesulfobacteriota bacterium]